MNGKYALQTIELFPVNQAPGTSADSAKIVIFFGLNGPISCKMGTCPHSSRHIVCTAKFVTAPSMSAVRCYIRCTYIRIVALVSGLKADTNTSHTLEGDQTTTLLMLSRKLSKYI